MFASAHLATVYPDAGRAYPAPGGASPLPAQRASCLAHLRLSPSALTGPSLLPLSTLFSITYRCGWATDTRPAPQAAPSKPLLSHIFSSTYNKKWKTADFSPPLTPLESTHTVSVCKQMSYNSFKINTYTHCFRQPLYLQHIPKNKGGGR